ncbi:hypothetical protein JCM19047_3478 [Bacillus sp. JCM 19047]|nr:hypothetical protein JCM19047_3478 [Bacillus sp. JCM 19047]
MGHAQGANHHLLLYLVNLLGKVVRRMAKIDSKETPVVNLDLELLGGSRPRR